MTATIDTLETALNLDLSLAWSELAEARARQSRKDAPAHRAAVAEILARIDALLDMRLAAGTTRSDHVLAR
jgi:hypothetical protein